MKFFEKMKEFCSNINTVEHTFEKWCAIITTVDNRVKQCNFTWAKASNIICSVPDFILIDKKYFKDTEGVMYPIQNIVSIEWKKQDTIIKEIPYEDYDFRFFYTDEELGIDK